MALLKEHLNKIFFSIEHKKAMKAWRWAKKNYKKEAFNLMNGTDPFCLCRGIIFNLVALSCRIDAITQILRNTSIYFHHFFLSFPIFMDKKLSGKKHLGIEKPTKILGKKKNFMRRQ